MHQNYKIVRRQRMIKCRYCDSILPAKYYLSHIADKHEQTILQRIDDVENDQTTTTQAITIIPQD